MEAFYAFCRRVDDAVDEASSASEAQKNIGYWKSELNLLYLGKGNDLVTQALIPAVRRYSIPKIYFDEIIKGCETDITTPEYPTFRDLEEYCYRVASCVGLACLHIFSATLTPELQEGAVALGKGLQITNILRDIRSDLQRPRLYLPLEDLRRFEVDPKDLRDPSQKKYNLEELFYFEIKRAEHYFEEAWKKFPKKSEAFKLLPALLMGRFYEKLLDKISRNPLSVFEEKISLSFQEKTEIAFKTFFGAFLKR